MLNPIRLFIGGFLTVLTLALFLSTYFTVDGNSVAVVTRFGQFVYVADAGLHFKLPFINGTTDYRTDIQEAKPDKPVNTYTVDNQEVDVVFTIFYRLPVDKVAYLYQNNRDYKARMLSLAVDRLKAAMGQVNVQIVAEKRGELRDTIKATLVHDVRALGVEIVDFQLTDMQYTEAFRTAVNNAAVQKANIEGVEYQRQQAEKYALTAKIKAEGEANAARAQAGGEADARVLKATAEAKAIQLQGEATAAAIKAQSDALKTNAALVDLERAKRWDGKLPSHIYGSAPIPFMGMGAN